MKLTLQDLKDISLVLYAHNLRGHPPNKDIEPLRQKVDSIIALKDLDFCQEDWYQDIQALSRIGM